MIAITKTTKTIPIQMYPAGDQMPAGCRCGHKRLPVEPLLDKPVNPPPGPAWIADRSPFRPCRFFKSPMPLVAGALPDPGLDFADFRLGEPRSRRGHFFVIAARQTDTAQQLTLVRLSGDQRSFTRFSFCGGPVELVQSKTGFPGGFIRSVACQAMGRQEWPDVPVKVNFRLG